MSDGLLFDDKYKVALLMDFYGSLLTEKTAEIMRLSLDEDMSLGEIADIKGVSRQAIHDSIRRGEENLIRYETELRMVQRTLETREIVSQMKTAVGLDLVDETRTKLTELLDELDNLF